MARPRKHGVVLPHPAARFSDKIKLYQKRRGPDDLLWGAQFRLNDGWTPKVPLSLGTKDWHEAVEVARDKFVLADAGSPYGARLPNRAEQTFAKYAAEAAADLRVKAEVAKKVAAGKEINFLDLARRIERILVPAFGNLPIGDINEDRLNEWAESYRVNDVDATVAQFGPQRRGPDRQVVLKSPAISTLGNIDRAFNMVWLQASAAGVVSRRARPMIDKDAHGDEGEQRAFIDQDGCQAVYRFMASDRWLHSDNGHRTDYKRMLRAYIALLATAGVRPGLELKRTMLGDIADRHRDGVDALTMLVRKSAGKHRRERIVAAYESDVFPTREWLTDLLAWHAQRGATARTRLFDWLDDGVERSPHFGPGVKWVLQEANALLDPVTGRARCSYSFRHYFATAAISRRLTDVQIAEWMGTSPDMIFRHYNRWRVADNAHSLNGARKIDLLAAAVRRQTVSGRDDVAGCPMIVSPEDDDPELLELDWQHLADRAKAA